MDYTLSTLLLSSSFTAFFSILLLCLLYTHTLSLFLSRYTLSTLSEPLLLTFREHFFCNY